MDAIIYRPLSEADVADAARLVHEGQLTWERRATETLDDVRTRLQRLDRYTGFVAERDEGLVAVMAFKPELESVEPRAGATTAHAHLMTFYVKVSERGTGLADDAHEFILGQLDGAGYAGARLWTPQAAPRAQAFYLRWDWQPTGGSMVYAGLERIEFARGDRPSL